MSGALHAYRKVIALTGPLLPVVSFLGRLPTAMCQLGSVLLVAETSGSLATAGLAGGALALGQTAGGPLLGRAADRHGQRGVVLVAALVNAAAVTALVLAALAHAGTGLLALLGALAGASVPQVGPLARSRTVSLARRAGADERTVAAALSFEGTLDEVSFVLGPAFVGLAAALAHPAVALLVAAGLLAVCGTAFALHPTAGQVVVEERVRTPRTRLPGAVYALRVTMVLQGAMFGASQAGITAFTERLGRASQTGLVYAAMGVMSAAAGLAMVAVPERLALRARWRIATTALVVLSVPLLFVPSLGTLYGAVVVLGVAYAPHLITLFGLTERLVPAARLAESMAFLTSGIVGGQALALALSGRLAQDHGPVAAFAVMVVAAVLCAALSWSVRGLAGPGRAEESSAPQRAVPGPLRPDVAAPSDSAPRA
ncbi:MFS transporter [Streptomyces melanogenes]|uniref:MFS transporter n=1 Tax=Streptomyces melanogenes TaxID=67326 RepID=UPI0019B205C1|nr:MFS transporter [Streptomyces melanogenes]GGP81572.1 MFS transporter [Streptomyces melanogenes]